MQVSEPTTMITDYLVAALAGYFWWRLQDAARRRQCRSQRWWSQAFLATAIGALAGGTSHGFATQLGEAGWLVMWKITIYALAVASLCLLLAALQSTLQGGWRSWASLLAWAKFAVYALFMLQRTDFQYVIYDYGSNMVAVLLLSLWMGWRQRARASGWVVAGILVSFAAAQIQMSGLSLHRHFNHNDLFHVVQMLGLTLLYRGGLLLEDAEDTYQR